MLLEEIGSLLNTAGVASTTPSGGRWKLSYRGLPATPDQAVGVLLSGGFPQDGKAPIDRPTFQVLVRGARGDGSTLETKVEAVDSALNLQSSNVSGRVFVDIQRQGSPLWLGWDENERPMYSINYLAVRSRTT